MADLREQATQRWQRAGAARAPGVAIVLALVVAGPALAAAVQPAWRTLRTAPAEADALDAQWQQMQRLAAESKELRAAPPVAPAQSAAALKAATERLGGRAACARRRARHADPERAAPASCAPGWSRRAARRAPASSRPS